MSTENMNKNQIVKDAYQSAPSAATNQVNRVQTERVLKRDGSAQQLLP